MTEQLTKRRPDPFDGSAGARLCRMGLLTAAGDVEEAAMQVCTHIFAASFFDDLCDVYADQAQMLRIMDAFRELAERKDPQRIFLLLSLQYDGLCKPLPDPVWWLAGYPPALTRFSLGFAACPLHLMADMEKTKKEDDLGAHILHRHRDLYHEWKPQSGDGLCDDSKLHRRDHSGRGAGGTVYRYLSGRPYRGSCA